MATPTTPVWFITGCSTGFGHELARLVLARGWHAVVTARDRSTVSDLAGEAGDRALVLDLDVTDHVQVAATKHAVEGWSDALAAEVEALGIKVTCVAPGPFRTDWAGRSLRQTPSTLADDAETAGARLRGTAQNSGTQAGDPVRAGAAMIAVTEAAHPPRHLVLGAWGVEAVETRLRATLAEIEAWRATSLATDFPKT